MNEQVLARLRGEFAGVLSILRARAAELGAVEGLAAARPGYALRGDGTEPALVLAFHPGQVPADASAWSARLGVEVRTVIASPAEQLRGAERPSFGSPLRSLLDPGHAPGFAPPRRGSYRPPAGPHAPTLAAVEEEMEVTVCASPDAGWPVLRDFLAEGVKKRLTVAMYDFTAPHVETALLAALDGSNATLRLVIDGKPASGGVESGGVNGSDRAEGEVLRRLRKKLGDRFELARASVGAAGAVPRAYHIKVAVADGARLWLSSGNWQSSNLPPWDFAVAGDAPPLPLGRYNRDYHVALRSEALARCYAGFIEYDATLGGDFAGPGPDAEPMLLVPDDPEPEDFAPARRFEPLTVTGRVKVTPLLTPDNFPGFVLALLARARRRVWIQNQYIQPAGDGDNFPEFERLIEVVGELAARVDLRLCLRAIEEEHRDRLLAAGVRPLQIRQQRNCHAKLIVVDDEHVVVGSQNLSNLGFVANRDASLAFANKSLTAYFAEVFAHDWDRLKPMADGDSFAARVAAEGQSLAGHSRVPWSALFDSPPPAALPPRAIAAPAPTVADGFVIPFFGVDERGRRDSANVAAAAAALRSGAGSPEREQVRLGVMTSTPSFGLPPGAAAENLDEVGWGVVWGPSVPPDIKDALAPLLAHRRREVANDDLFHEFDHVRGDGAREFLQRRAVDFGTVRPDGVPYYLLLVGDPEEIPFSFQAALDVEYRVGRLDLPDATAYRRYADSVVAAETGQIPARDRVLHTFGPAHAGDVPTALSVEVLVRAAEDWLDAQASLRKKYGLTARVDGGDDATRARLVEVLRGITGRPEVLFTAGHGVVFDAGGPRQASEQGALVTAEWDGTSVVDASALFAAADVPADADVGGLVAFLFACFGAGTPATDVFPTRAGQVLAPRPFVSALPRALLSHPGGAALGVFGHVDRTLTWSLRPPPPAPVATGPFASAALHVLIGHRLGAALDDLNQRGATLAATVASALTSNNPLDDIDLVKTWTQQRDAAAFILLGDPAARLRR